MGWQQEQSRVTRPEGKLQPLQLRTVIDDGRDLAGGFTHFHYFCGIGGCELNCRPSGETVVVVQDQDGAASISMGRCRREILREDRLPLA